MMTPASLSHLSGTTVASPFAMRRTHLPGAAENA
jgi:hypothetical protein